MTRKPTIEQIKQLPLSYQATIPSDYLDEMGHMNVMWYTYLYGLAIRDFHNSIGFDRQYIEDHRFGTFAIEKHLRYKTEVLVGEQVSVFTRAIDCGEQQYHLLQFMINDTHNRLASTMETVSAHVDLKNRRSAPMPPNIYSAFRREVEQHAALDWEPTLCKVMGIR